MPKSPTCNIVTKCVLETDPCNGIKAIVLSSTRLLDMRIIVSVQGPQQPPCFSVLCFSNYEIWKLKTFSPCKCFSYWSWYFERPNPSGKKKKEDDKEMGHFRFASPVNCTRHTKQSWRCTACSCQFHECMSSSIIRHGQTYSLQNRPVTC